MAGKIDKGQTHLLRATQNGEWELWAFHENKAAHLVRRMSRPSDAPRGTVVTIPVDRTYTFPAWLSTGDPSVIPEMLQLQLEQRGLLTRNSRSTMMDYRVVEAGENRSLAVATILQSDFPPELTFEKAGRFEPAAFALPLPQNRLTIWKERGRLAAAATRGGEPVHFQVLSDPEVSDSVVRELRCVLYQLEVQNLGDQIRGLTLWGDFTEPEIHRLEDGLGLRASCAEFPPPRLPKPPSKLFPPQVALLHDKRRHRNRVRQIVYGLVVLYLLAILGLVGYIGWQKYELARARQLLASETPTVNAIESTADRWRKLQWAVDPHVYPVELLSQISNLLPSEGMRLTAFEIQKGKITVRGEASAAPAAFQFAESIKANPALQMFRWQMPSPSLRPDGRAEFIIEGEPRFAKIN